MVYLIVTLILIMLFIAIVYLSLKIIFEVVLCTTSYNKEVFYNNLKK